MSQVEQTSQPGAADSFAERFRYPPWANYLVPAGVILAIGILTYIPLLLGLSLSPLTTDVGYQPKQPIDFSHAMHAGDLKMDCRYCHSTVDQAAYAAIPSTAICMNCHASIKSESTLLESMRDSYAEGSSMKWFKIHTLPDFAYFNHSAHINKGVGCVSCHGRIDQMIEVYQSQPISMGWCLDCHRAPEKSLRPRDQVTNMNWEAQRETGKTQAELGTELKQSYHIQSTEFMTSCTTCHR